MASLSNINGLFDVHSTGAILFSTSHGASGQILRSNGNAAPTWVAASTVIGGPYLPLAGGTLTGATSTATGISFTIGGNLFVTGTSTLTGALSGSTATFSGNVTGPRFIGTSNNSDRTEAVDSNDTRSTNPDPEDIGSGVYFDFKNNSTNGLYDGGAYNGMMLWRSYGGGSDLSGGQPIRLAYTASGNLWRQMGTGATSWGAWNKFAICTGTSSQYIRGDGSIVNFPTITTGTVTSVATGLGLTGGTITSTGTISLNRDATQLGAVLATYGTTGGAGAGRVRCTAPFNTNSSKMFSIEITLYTSYTQHNYVVSAYMYSSTNQWYSPRAIYTTTGSATPDIYVGRDNNGYAYISIVNASYTGVLVHNMTRGYTTSLANTYEPWAITIDAGNENSVGVSTTQVWTTANLSINDLGGLPLTGGIMSGNIGRSAFNSGYQVGGYNSISPSESKTNPIHAIGTSYLPTATALSNMYGIGYTRGDASFMGVAQGSGWGLYVASDGDARIFLDSSAGDIYAANKLCVNSYANQAGGLLFSAGQTTGTTRSLNLRTTNITSDPSSADTSDATGITWGQRTDSNPYYIIYPKRENYNSTGDYSKLTIAWHTGIRIGASQYYGGTRFYNDAPDISGASVIMNVGVQNNNVGVVNDLLVGSSVNAARFRADNGTAAVPTYSFTSDTDIGMYREGTNILGFSTVGARRACITATGNFIIGTETSTACTLKVSSTKNGSESSPHFCLTGNGYTALHWLDTVAYYIMQNSTGRQIRIISNSGGVKLTVNATAWASNSDIALKENLKPLENVLDKVKDYRCVEYNLKESPEDKKIGFIAQDWENDFPAIVDKDENDMLGMKYTETIPVLLKAIQELETRVKELENK